MAEFSEPMGVILTRARESAGLELAEAAAMAQIPRSVAEALEAENFSEFASPVYAKSFLLKYSEFLKVDAQPWLQALQPGKFMPSGDAGAVLQRAAPMTQSTPEVPESRGGLLSVFGFLLVLAILMFAALKAYEFFDQQFTNDSGQSQSSPVIEKSENPGDANHP